jgi:hypothetical protein
MNGAFLAVMLVTWLASLWRPKEGAHEAAEYRPRKVR